MNARFRSLLFVLIGFSFLLGSCGDSTGPGVAEEEEEIRDFAASTPVGALAGFLGLDVNAGSASAAAIDMFLKIPDIPGESEDADHEDEIDVERFSWGASLEVGRDEDGSRTGLSRLGDIVIRKKVDRASHELTHVVQQNAVLPEVVLSIRADGAAGEAKYFEVTLTDARVVSQSTGTAGDVPTEEIAFSFQEVTWTLPGLMPVEGTVGTVTPVDAIVEFLDLDVNGPEPTAALVDFYLEIPTIPGESEEAGHEDEIEIHGVEWGTVLDLDAVAKTARVRGIELSSLKAGDTSTAAIEDAASRGEIFSEMVLSLRGGGPSAAPDYLRITLEDVIISSVSQGGTPGAAPMEQLTLNYERVRW
jgi:type VI secretion system secreted protein Hcp